MSRQISIPVLPPYPWEAILRYLTFRLTPGVETVAGGRYVRQTPAGRVSVEFVSSKHALVAESEGDIPGLLPRLTHLFDTGHDPDPIGHALAACPILGPRIRKLPGLRAPGCWEPFELCLRVILGQQVAVKSAHTLMGHLTALCPSLDSAELAAGAIANLRLPTRRRQTLQTLAERVAAGEIRFGGRPWAATASQLAAVPGFGPWTLQYLGIRLGRDPDAFPVQDLGLLRATGVGSARELEKLAESWRPYRGYAAMYLWLVD